MTWTRKRDCQGRSKLRTVEVLTEELVLGQVGSHLEKIQLERFLILYKKTKDLNEKGKERTNKWLKNRVHRGLRSPAVVSPPVALNSYLCPNAPGFLLPSEPTECWEFAQIAPPV